MTKRLLLVDDDLFIRSVAQDVLEQEGYSIDVAGDGQEAWHLLVADPLRYRLILLDKQMPILDGLGLLKRIKADNRFDGVPVVMLTGADSVQDVSDGLAAGAYYYLTKPFDEVVLVRVIKNALVEFERNSTLRTQVGTQTNTLSLLQRAEFSYRNLQEARNLALWLSDVCGDPQRTVSGYSEILINAVEHGNLAISYTDKGMLLDEGRWLEEVELRLQNPAYAARTVKVVMDRIPTGCTVTVIDQGAGFDWQRYLEFSQDRIYDLHGRGIAMSKTMSFDRLEYLGCGNTVVITVHHLS